MQRSLFWKCCQAIARIFTSLLFDLRVYGVENVPATGGFLLAPNHQSYLDPVFVAVRLRRPVSYLAKSELFENPVLRWLITSLHAFPVRKGRGDLAAVRETIKRLEEGNVLNMYPEGTRTLDGSFGQLQKGITLILKKISVPVIPVAIDGSYQIWPKGRKIFRSGHVRVIYGKPLYFKDMKADEILIKLRAAIAELLAELQRIKALESWILQ